MLAAIGTELFHSSDAERRELVIAEALEIARGLGDPVLLARVLHASTFSQKSSAGAFARRDAAAELAEIADAAKLGDDVRLMAQFQIVLIDYGLGNLVAAHAGLMSCVALLDRPVNQALRSQIGFFRALIEMIRGNYDGADGRFEAAIEMFRRGRPAEANAFRLGQVLTLGHDRGGIPEAVLNRTVASNVGGYGLVWQLYTAVILFDTGRSEEAIQRVPYRRGGVPERPDDYTSIFVDVAAAYIAAESNDVVSAGLLLDRLLPMAGRWAGGGSAALVLGPVDLALARLYVTLGQPAEAERWFASAVLSDERMASPAWLARSLLYQGRFFSEQGRSLAAQEAFDRCWHDRDRTWSGDRCRSARQDPSLATLDRQGFAKAIPNTRAHSVGMRTPSPTTVTSVPDMESYLRVHRLLRLSAAALADRTRRSVTNVGDSKSAASDRALVRWFQGFAEEIRCHHHIEDALLFPALEARVTVYGALAPRLVSDHADLDVMLDQLTAALRDGDAAAAAALSLVCETISTSTSVSRTTRSAHCSPVTSRRTSGTS